MLHFGSNQIKRIDSDIVFLLPKTFSKTCFVIHENGFICYRFCFNLVGRTGYNAFVI